MQVYVIRHGLTELNKQGVINGHIDDFLAPEGIDQAKIVIPLLPKTIQHIYSSSLGRAKQTASIVNETLNLPLTFHDELKEVNFGILNGTPFLDEYKLRHKMLDYDWRPSGESFEDVNARVLKILNIIKKESSDGSALIVAHGGIVRLMHFLECGESLGEIENASLYSFNIDRMRQLT